MFAISKEVEFDAGHRVPNHSSKCRNPHGHRYRVRVTIGGELVTTPGASDEGMLADFGDLKTVMMEHVHDVFDHGFVVHEEDSIMRDALSRGIADTTEGWKVIVVPWIPTAENFSKHIWEVLEPYVEKMGFWMSCVDVWETPTSIATYLGR